MFALSTTGSMFNTIHTFAGTDGSLPSGDLLRGTDGNLYGTTHSGGTNGDGSVCRVQTDGSNFTSLYSFSNTSDGAKLIAGVIEGPDGNLYGTTTQGGVGPSADTAVAGTAFVLQTQIPLIVVSSVTLSTSTVSAGSSLTGTVTLTKSAPAGGITVTLSSSSSIVTVPTSTLTMSPTTVKGGNTATATVTLNSSVTIPTGGLSFVLTSTNRSVVSFQPTTIIIYHKSGTATINTKTVTSQTPVNITATCGTSSQTVPLTVTP